MQLYSENKSYKLYQGSMLDMLDYILPNTIDSVVTDPPYELNFMGKGWDNAGISFKSETWKKCYDVLKPGGYLLAFGGSRTFHRIACAIEDAGFEIRDTIMWIYGSGFPKSMNIELAIDKKNGYDKVLQTNESKKWKGWGSCLKPSFEPIIVARKPFTGSLVDNIMEYGVGGLNIDECRVPFEDTPNPATNPLYRQENGYKHDRSKSTAENSNVKFSTSPSEKPISTLGRFPANTILTYDESGYDEVCGGFPMSGSGNNKGVYNYAGREYDNKDTSMFNGDKPQAPSNYNDNGSASRYFYCAKASKKDRDEGLNVRNTHPTVKPTELMQYLIRLVTPNGGTILDPFNGSGSTGKATMYENRERNKDYKYIGIELTEEYLPIARARIEHLIDASELDESREEFKPTTINPSDDEVPLW